MEFSNMSKKHNYHPLKTNWPLPPKIMDEFNQAAPSLQDDNQNNVESLLISDPSGIVTTIHDSQSNQTSKIHGIVCGLSGYLSSPNQQNIDLVNTSILSQDPFFAPNMLSSQDTKPGLAFLEHRKYLDQADRSPCSAGSRNTFRQEFGFVDGISQIVSQIVPNNYSPRLSQFSLGEIIHSQSLCNTGQFISQEPLFAETQATNSIHHPQTPPATKNLPRSSNSSYLTSSQLFRSGTPTNFPNVPTVSSRHDSQTESLPSISSSAIEELEKQVMLFVGHDCRSDHSSNSQAKCHDLSNDKLSSEEEEKTEQFPKHNDDSPANPSTSVCNTNLSGLQVGDGVDSRIVEGRRRAKKVDLRKKRPCIKRKITRKQRAPKFTNEERYKGKQATWARSRNRIKREKEEYLATLPEEERVREIERMRLQSSELQKKYRNSRKEALNNLSEEERDKILKRKRKLGCEATKRNKQKMKILSAPISEEERRVQLEKFYEINNVAERYRVVKGG